MSGSNVRSLHRQHNKPNDPAKLDGAKILLSGIQTRIVEQDALIKQLTINAGTLKDERDHYKASLDSLWATLLNIASIKGWLTEESGLSEEGNFDPNKLLEKYQLELVGDEEAVAAAEEILKEKWLARREAARLKLIAVEAERGCNYQVKLAEGKNLAPDGKTHSPIHEHDDGSWWLYDRKWKSEFGPFEDEIAATKGCEGYMKFCESGQVSFLPHCAFDAFKQKMKEDFEAYQARAKEMREEFDRKAEEERVRLQLEAAVDKSEPKVGEVNPFTGEVVVEDSTPVETIPDEVEEVVEEPTKRFVKKYGDDSDE